MTEPRIPRDKAAALHVLGPIKDSPYVKPFVYPALDGGWIDFDGIIISRGHSSLSNGERHLFWLARSLYNRGHVDIGALAAAVDEASWVRVIEGLTMLRGLEEGLSILPGDWIDGIIA